MINTQKPTVTKYTIGFCQRFLCTIFDDILMDIIGGKEKKKDRKEKLLDQMKEW